MGTPLRPLRNEFAHAVVTQSHSETTGRTTSEVCWFLQKEAAEAWAERDIADAMEGEYSVEVYLVTAVKLCHVKDGKVED